MTNNTDIVAGIESLIVKANQLGKQINPSSKFTAAIADDHGTVCYELGEKSYEAEVTYRPDMSATDFLCALHSAAFDVLHRMAMLDDWRRGVFLLCRHHRRLDPGMLVLGITIQNEHSQEYQLNSVENWLWCWEHHDASLPGDDTPVVDVILYRRSPEQKAVPMVKTPGMTFLNLMSCLNDTFARNRQTRKMGPMIRRNPDGSLFQEMFDGVRCDCGCNVFHETSSSSVVDVVCNSCGKRIGQLTEDAAQEALKNGIWKKEESQNG